MLSTETFERTARPAPHWPRCAAAAVATFAATLTACDRDSELQFALLAPDTTAVDTIAAIMPARAGRCPGGGGWVIEGVAGDLAALVWLPADTTGTYEVDATVSSRGARIVIHRASDRQLELWRADSGLVWLERGQARRGRFSARADTMGVVGRFAVGRPTPDSTACPR